MFQQYTTSEKTIAIVIYWLNYRGKRWFHCETRLKDRASHRIHKPRLTVALASNCQNLAASLGDEQRVLKLRWSFAICGHSSPLIGLQAKYKSSNQMFFVRYFHEPCKRKKIERTHCSSRHVPSDIMGSMVNALPAFITPTALLSLKGESAHRYKLQYYMRCTTIVMEVMSDLRNAVC